MLALNASIPRTRLFVPRHPWLITAGLVALTVLVALVAGVAQPLEFQRAAMDAGQWWRLLTGHLVHCNFEHLLWSLGTFCVLGVLCERRSRAAYAACLGFSAIAIGLTVWLLTPMETYRGLSGLDSALFALLSVLVFAESRAVGDRVQFVVCLVLTAAFAAKVAFEALTAQAIFVQSAGASFAPVPLAHAVGALIGALCGLITVKHSSPMEGPRDNLAIAPRLSSGTGKIFFVPRKGNRP